jgi:hypothetical protein
MWKLSLFTEPGVDELLTTNQNCKLSLADPGLCFDGLVGNHWCLTTWSLIKFFLHAHHFKLIDDERQEEYKCT